MEPEDTDEQPRDDDAVDAAEQMNDPNGAHPGVSDEEPDREGDEPLPEQMP